MKKTDSPKIIASRSLIAGLCIVFGILIAGQLRSIPDRVVNPIAPYASLKETKEDLYNEQAELKTEIKRLQAEIGQIQKGASEKVLSKEEISQLNAKKAQAGLTKLNGPGIIITLDDSKVKPATDDSIVHAADLRDLVNALWGAGTEAISINGQRLVLNSAIDCIVNTILINDVRLSNPFRIEAIGNNSELFRKISDPAVLSGLHTRRQKEGLIFNIEKNPDITVPVFDGSLETNLRESDV